LFVVDLSNLVGGVDRSKIPFKRKKCTRRGVT
jgi:hypothetical protein